jgi:hypothetical protein
VEFPAAEQIAALPLRLSNAVMATLGTVEPIAPLPEGAPGTGKRAAKTEIGTAVLLNSTSIVASTAGLWLPLFAKRSQLFLDLKELTGKASSSRRSHCPL